MMNGILGSSQTFVGVLTTLVVLCVVAGQGNFITSILEEIIKSTVDEIESLKSQVHAQVIAITAKWKKVNPEKLIELVNSCKGISDKKKSEIFDQQLEFELKLSGYTLSFSENHFLPVLLKIKEIKNSREQTFSPLYIFAYCILIFLCDEVTCWFPETLGSIITFVSIFSIFSFAFLFVFWCKFYNEYQILPPYDEEEVAEQIPLGTKLLNAIVTAIALGGIFFFFVMFLSVLVSGRLVCPSLMWWYRGAIISQIILTVILVAWQHYRIRRAYGDYPHSFLFVHFFGLVGISGIYTFIFAWPVCTPEYVLFDCPENLWILRLGIIVTIILHGIIFPFMLPFLGNYHVRNVAQHSGENAINEARATYAEIDSWAHATLDQIRSNIKDFHKKSSGVDTCLLKILNKLFK